MLLFSISILCIYFSFAQSYISRKSKPLVTPNIFGKWPSIESPAVCNDGKYVKYYISNYPLGGSTLVVMASDCTWRKEISVEDQGSLFTADSRKLIFKNDRDSLGIIKLGTEDVEYIPNVSQFKLSGALSDEWLACQMLGTLGELILFNLSTKKQERLLSVNDFRFSQNGKSMIAQIDSVINDTHVKSLWWINLVTGMFKQIWNGEVPGSYVFDLSGSRLAFTTSKAGNVHSDKSIFYYDSTLENARLLLDREHVLMGDSLQIGDIVAFSQDGSRLFFDLTEKISNNFDTSKVQLDIYSYRDASLQSVQAFELQIQRSYFSVINIDNHKTYRLEQKGDQIDRSNLFQSDYADDFLVIKKEKKQFGLEFNWNIEDSVLYFLLDTRNGMRKFIASQAEYTFAGPWLTPGNKYVIFYSPKLKNYFSYSVSSGIIRNITKGIKAIWVKRGDTGLSYLSPEGIAGFLKGDSAVIIKGQNDLYQISLDGNSLPVHLTNGYGYKRNIVFRPLMDDRTGYGSKYYTTLKASDKLILKAFDINSKNDGFYTITIGKQSDPIQLTMAPYMFCGFDESQNGQTFVPLKARDASAYLVRRQSASDAPSYFFTSDFISYNRLSDIQPEHDFNWLTSELITWKTSDGSASQGILYKPENFDPKKKYPVIFFYYEKFSETLHQFLYPQAEGAWINIPSYVSDGYLVFVPDIHFRIGYPGNSVVNAVVSAAQYLSKMPWVDAKRMGIQGHSRGGYETNYLVTHSNIFAAAMSASGMSDYVGLSGVVHSTGIPRRSAFELGPQRIGATLWERPDLYIHNSPIFYVDKVTTPILMMSNEMDRDVPYEQGLEFFTSLRRLGKKAWMLQYHKQGHVVNGKAAEDMSIRMKQFFDFYLKDAEAPKWMIEGIPAYLKGVDDGLKLEPKGVKPGAGLLKPEEQKKVDNIGRLRPITIIFR